MLPAIVGAVCLVVGVMIGACLAWPIARYRDRLSVAVAADYSRQLSGAMREMASACRSIDSAVCALAEQQSDTCRHMARVADRLERR